jgi:hypothetical protein
LQPDTIYVGHLASSTDSDLFKISVAEGQTMSAILSNLPADFDLTLYAPTGTPLANRVSERVLVPIQDELIGLPGEPTAAPADPADDLSLENALVYAVGQRRDTGDERIDTGRLSAGVYYLKVTGFNEAASTKPYALRVTMETPVSTIPPCAAWPFVGDSIVQGSLPNAGAYADVNTIFVVNQERLFGKFPIEANSVMTGLSSFVTSTNANPALGVKALVVPIDGDPAVHNAYKVWEQADNRCKPLVARDVSSAIATALDAILVANPQIQNVVMVGGDDLIPFGRVPDTTQLANEREFAPELDGNNELVAAARGGWILTDDVYVDRAPIQVGTNELYVPNVALGRLVETPTEIVSALNDFVTFGGHLDARTALSVGYDFLADGANAVKSALVNNGFSTDANANGLIGETWTAQDLKNALLGLNGFNVPDIAAVNAHFDDSRALPADENLNQTETNLFTTADLPLVQALARSLLFSVGCHGGLNVPDTTQPGRNADWAQSYSTQGAVWIGNTGFGYGDDQVVAASEKLMALFAERLNGKFTVGQALLLAKQGYVGDLGQIITSYDVKVSQEMTYYGLPMYRLSAAPAVPDPAPVPPAVTTDVRVNLDSAPLSIATAIAVPEFATPDQPGVLNGHVVDRGTYYTVDGDALTVQNRPIQPRTTRDVTRVSPTTGLPLGTATGMLVTQLISQDRFGVNPVVYRPIVDSSAETEPPTVENIFPAAPVSIGSYTDLVTIGGQTVPITRQQVVAIPGQFRGGVNGGAGTQRLFTDINGVVYYAPPGSTDTTSPSISFADAVVNGGSASFTVRAADGGDPAAIRRVFVLAIPSNPGLTPVSWAGVDLTPTGTGMWTGGIVVPPSTTSVEFIVQVVDSAGNVGVSSNKGVLYQNQPTPTPTADSPVVVVDPAPPVGGWLRASATVTVSDPNALALTYSVDRGPEAVYTAPFVVSGAGAHEVVVRNSAGRVTSVRVPIDNAGPVTQCAIPPTTWSGTDVSVGCVSTDDGVGLANQADTEFALTTAVPDNTETDNAATGTRAICDSLSQCTTAGPVVGIRVDRKAPSIDVTSPIEGDEYGVGELITATYACADGGSGLTQCAGTVASTLPIDTATPGAKTFTVTARDAVGNLSSRAVSYSVADRAAPTIECDPVPIGWSATNVTINCTASDQGGLASAEDSSFSLSTSVSAGSETANAATPGRTVCDTSGNCATAGPFTGITVDRKAPTITITTPVNGATYTPGQIVNAAYSCNEGGSGEVSCGGPVAVGAPIDTVTPGVKTFAVTSVDAVGNSATSTVSYTVTAVNDAPVVVADMGVTGLQEVGFQSGAVILTGSINDPDGPGPYSASVRWTSGGPFTPLILNNSTTFVAAWFYATPGTRTVTVRVCDAAGHCGTDDVLVRSHVTQRVTPTRCVVDRGATATPRYEARFGYVNPAPFAIFVPTLAGIENTFTTGAAYRGQPQVFLLGARTNTFAVRFGTGSISWRLNNTTVTASSLSPRC